MYSERATKQVFYKVRTSGFSASDRAAGTHASFRSRALQDCAALSLYLIIIHRHYALVVKRGSVSRPDQGGKCRVHGAIVLKVFAPCLLKETRVVKDEVPNASANRMTSRVLGSNDQGPQGKFQFQMACPRGTIGAHLGSLASCISAKRGPWSAIQPPLLISRHVRCPIRACS